MNKSIKTVMTGIMIVFIFACSKSDSNSEEELTTSIIGTWRQLRYVDICSTGAEEIDEWTVCMKQSRVEFSNIGTVKSTSYSDACSDPNSNTPYISNGMYSIKDGSLKLTWQGDNGEDIDIETWIIDILDSKILRLKQNKSNAYPGDACVGEGEWVAFYVEFDRVD